MATIKRFEDLDVWKKARELSQEVYKVSTQGKFSRDFELRNQINASSGSAMDNIAEGFDRGGRNEFVNFLSMAKGSCGEVKSQLYRASDREYITGNDFQRIYNLANETGKIINGLIGYLNKSKVSGTKFKNRSNLN